MDPVVARSAVRSAVRATAVAVSWPRNRKPAAEADKVPGESWWAFSGRRRRGPGVVEHDGLDVAGRIPIHRAIALCGCYLHQAAVTARPADATPVGRFVGRAVDRAQDPALVHV